MSAMKQLRFFNPTQVGLLTDGMSMCAQHAKHLFQKVTKAWLLTHAIQ